MSQLAVHGADALDLDSPLDVVDPFADTVVFERLPMRPAEPFPPARLRLAVPTHHEGGRRQPGARAAVPVAARRPQGEMRARRRQPVRLTRRGRIVCVIALALLTTAIVFAVGAVPSQASPVSGGAASTEAASIEAASTGAGAGGAAASVVVQPGDSLWSIAVAAAPGSDPRATVQKIIDLNHLAGVEIEAGQTLALPA